MFSKFEVKNYDRTLKMPSINERKYYLILMIIPYISFFLEIFQFVLHQCIVKLRSRPYNIKPNIFIFIKNSYYSFPRTLHKLVTQPFSNPKPFHLRKRKHHVRPVCLFTGSNRSFTDPQRTDFHLRTRPRSEREKNIKRPIGFRSLYITRSYAIYVRRVGIVKLALDFFGNS